MKNQLTEDQRKAILAYAKEKGRHWKQSLRDDWSRADPRINGESSPELQQIRNVHGSMWLNRVRLKDLEVEGKKPIHVLMDTVADAIRAYDKTDDHLKHAPGADCIRCKLESSIVPTPRVLFCKPPFYRSLDN